MANVKFLRGLQASLPTSNFTEGAFYLTTDTNRLYVAQSSDNLALLNQTVRIVASETELNGLDKTKLAKNDFCYISDKNVLAVYNGTGWVQVNPDTYLVAKTNAITASEVTDHKEVKAALALADSKGHAVSGQVNFVAGTENVSLDVDENKKIVISVAAPETVEYDLVKGTGNVVDLQKKVGTADATTEGSIEFAAGDNASVAVTSASGKTTVTYAADNMYNTSFSAGSAAEGFSFSVVDGAGTKSGSINPQITVGSTVTETKKFLNGTASLPVYTISEVNSLLEEYEEKVTGLTYKGTVEAKPTSATGYANGDMVKLSKASGDYKAGDVFILHNGVWEHIPSGDEKDTTYTIGTTSDTLSIGEVGSSANKGSISVKGVENNPVTVSGAVDANKNVVITAQHSAKTFAGSAGNAITQTAKNSQEFTVVDSITGDGYGHVSSYQTRKVTVVDTHANVNSVAATTTTATKGASLSIAVADTDAVTKSDAITVTSDSLTVTAGTKNVNVELVWGSFN